MPRKSLIFEGPDGLLPFELVTLLGLMILDSNARGYLFQNKCKEDVPETDIDTTKKCMTVFFDGPLRTYVTPGTTGPQETGQSGDDLMKKWNGKVKGEKTGAKARIDDILEWSEANRKMLECLRNDLTAFLKQKYHSDSDDYSECDFKGADLLELLECARLANWRRL